MTILLAVAELLLVATSGVFLGYQIGLGRGEDDGYAQGYHDGQFDAEVSGT